MAVGRNERTADDPSKQNLGQIELRSRRAIANLARFENQKRAAPLKFGLYPNALRVCAFACESFHGAPRPCAWATRRRRRRSPPEWERCGRLRLPARPHSAHLWNQQLACSKAPVSYDRVRGLRGRTAEHH